MPDLYNNSTYQGNTIIDKIQNRLAELNKSNPFTFSNNVLNVTKDAGGSIVYRNVDSPVVQPTAYAGDTILDKIKNRLAELTANSTPSFIPTIPIKTNREAVVDTEIHNMKIQKMHEESIKKFKNQQQEGKNYAEKIASIKIPKNNIDVTWEVAMRQGKDKRWRIENIPKNTGSMGSVNVDRLFEGNTVNINANNIKDLFSIYKVRPEKQKEYGGKLKSIGNIDLETNPYATRPTHIQEIKEIYNQVKDYSYKDMQKEFERLGSPLQYISGQISDSLIKYGITPGEFIAVVRKDSGAGTSGSARVTKTPGNVGAYDNKVPMKFATWIEGSVATIRNLAERKV